MKNHIYTSILKNEMIGFFKMRESKGLKIGHKFILESLDKHLALSNVSEKSLTAKEVDTWLADVCKGQSTRSINGYIGYYNAFAKYLRMLGIESFTPEYVRVRETYLPYIFSEQEIANIFISADSIKRKMYTNHNKHTKTQIQFPMLLRLLYGCGLRLGEALSLKKSDVDIVNGVLFIRSAKGNRDRFVPMDGSLTSALSQYYNYILKDKLGDAWLFENDAGAGKPRGSSWADERFRSVIKAAGIHLQELPPKQRNICLHCLRHTFIVRSFRKQDLAGVDNYDPAASISLYVGHFNLNGTQHYMHMTAENSVDIINATTEYSKEMFPLVPVETNNIGENETLIIAKPLETINSCSKGMFPEVPQ